MERRVILVTGANKGIGKATVRHLAMQGHLVYLGSRDLGRGEQAVQELAAEGVTVKHLVIDVTNQASVTAAIRKITLSEGRLDTLVNNAGSHAMTPTLDMTVEEAKANYETDVWGPMRVLLACLPLLRESPAPRIVNVASTVASFSLVTAPGSMYAGIDSLLAYASGKSALNMMTVQYAFAFARQPEFAKFRINAVTPGWVSTDLSGHSGGCTPDEGSQIIVEYATIGDDGPSGKFLNRDGAVPW
jgi:NAD(P)-dependent dehydrogenase (short-subunit alcohol dehydrogenase family)